MAEASKNRDFCRKRTRKDILTPRLGAAAKRLREDDSIVIRKADKTSIYVILDRSEYDKKIDAILSVTSKFEKIRADPTNTLKKKANQLIAAANAEVDGVHFKTTTGDYKPGYIYGNAKIHKEHNPLRPIISQVPTPTYTEKTN